MSNAIRYDSLLVRDLADELRTRLSGRRVRAVAFRREGRKVDLRFTDFTLTFDLDPTRGGLLRGPALRERGNVPVAKGSRIESVDAPADERLIEIGISAGREGPGLHTLIIELVTNRWNAWALGPDRRVLAVLRPGGAAARAQLPGDVYAPPHLSLRLGVREPVSFDEWLRLLLPSPPRERRRRVLEALAYTSPINAGAILGSAASSTDAQDLRDAYDRYVRVVSADDRAPCLLEPDGAAQPYGLAVLDDALPQPGLIEAFEEAARRAGGPAPAGAGARAEEAADRLAGRLRQVERRIQRLRAELDGAPLEAETRRRVADLLMSQLHRVRKGDTHVDLEDFEGGRIRIDLDPALSPAENAQGLYDSARKRDRAAATLPRLLERGAAERDALLELIERVRSGQATQEEVGAVLVSDDVDRRGRRPDTPSLPYRRYRTAGGLEVRVGRGSAANDALTFHNSSPDDIWMHARDVAGAHVILRWTDREANPPARDLHQAAVLAALHSRARTSGTVPVDWTRRKYVRKPRKAPPGRVTIERARTLFVEPEPALEEKMRWAPLEDVVESG